MAKRRWILIQIRSCRVRSLLQRAIVTALKLETATQWTAEFSTRALLPARFLIDGVSWRVSVTLPLHPWLLFVDWRGTRSPQLTTPAGLLGANHMCEQAVYRSSTRTEDSRHRTVPWSADATGHGSMATRIGGRALEEILELPCWGCVHSAFLNMALRIKRAISPSLIEFCLLFRDLRRTSARRIPDKGRRDSKTITIRPGDNGDFRPMAAFALLISGEQGSQLTPRTS
jgi:hypothetical protein